MAAKPSSQQRGSTAKDLKTLVNEVVLSHSEIDVIFIYDLESSTLLEHSDSQKPRSTAMVKSLFESENNLEMGEGLSEFGDIRDLPRALHAFGKETGCGELEYATFQMSNGIIQAYFLTSEETGIGTNVAMCFASAQPRGLGKFVLQCEKNFDSIKDALIAAI